MANRRGNHEGSLYFHKTRNRWCAQVTLNGHRITKYGKTRVECREWIKEMIAKVNAGLTYEGMQFTVEGFLEAWLNGKELSRRPKTVLQYRQVAHQHILPQIGGMQLQDVHPSHLKQLYALKRDEGRGARTVQLIHAVLHNAFKQAVLEGILGRNPADAVERPRVEQSEMQTLHENQARQFLLAAMGSPFETIYYLALTSGMREGELLGLKWSDLDLNKSTLFVQRQLQQIPGQGYVLVPPKTKAGRREIKLGQGTLTQLEAHRERQKLAKTNAGEKWQENDFIFPTSLGTPLDHKRVRKEFKRILKSANLPNIRFHDLRHTSLNALLDHDVPVNAVQKRAGHATPSTTVNIYGHATARSQEDAAEKIEELVSPIAVKLQSK